MVYDECLSLLWETESEQLRCHVSLHVCVTDSPIKTLDTKAWVSFSAGQQFTHIVTRRWENKGQLYGTRTPASLYVRVWFLLDFAPCTFLLG